MLERVSIEGVSLPRLYIAKTSEDAELAKRNGLPYIKWRGTKEDLIKQLLRPALEKMFPGILWNKVLGKRKAIKDKIIVADGNDYTAAEIGEHDNETMLEDQYAYDRGEIEPDTSYAFSENDDGELERIVDMADSPRTCSGRRDQTFEKTYQQIAIEDYVGDLSSSVDIDALQKLGLLPKFVGDIADCIKRNISTRLKWTEGYTKKLGVPLGNFNAGYELPNLIIIDISCSIPDGISSTMLALADTLREQCNADLIITSAHSGYYPAGCELPKPDTLRSYYGWGNESYDFTAILRDHIAGREFGHLISFGDFDNPGWVNEGQGETLSKCEELYKSRIDMTGTKIHEIHHYHTTAHARTGYARWAVECCPDAVEHFDCDWCSVVRK